MQEEITPPPAPAVSEPAAITAPPLEALRQIDRALFDEVEPALVFLAAPPAGAPVR